MVNMRGCNRKVHRSLLQRDLMLGVPSMGLVLIFVMAIVFLYLLHWFFMVVPIALSYVLIRHFTSGDPWLIEFWLGHLSQKDVYLP